MFRGVQHINLDAKGRMAVPSRQRELMSVLGDGHIVLTVDTQTPCLTLYPLPEWERIERRSCAHCLAHSLSELLQQQLAPLAGEHRLVEAESCEEDHQFDTTLFRLIQAAA